MICPSHDRGVHPLDNEGAGNAGCWPQPMARLRKKCRRQEPQVQPVNPAFPARWLYALCVLSPGIGLSCPRDQRIITASVASASRCDAQVHMALPGISRENPGGGGKCLNSMGLPATRRDLRSAAARRIKCPPGGGRDRKRWKTSSSVSKSDSFRAGGGPGVRVRPLRHK